jgi:hypothetical protein
MRPIVPSMQPMTSRAAELRPSSRALLWLTGAWTAAGTLLFLLWPALSPILLPLCVIMPLAWYFRDHPLRWIEISRFLVALVAAVAFAFINASWSLARDEAQAFAAMLAIVAICLHIGFASWARLTYGGPITATAIGFYVGYVLAGSFLCFEILSRHALILTFMKSFPQLWPQPARYVAAGGLPPHFLNHRMAALAILFWPLVLVVLHLGRTTAKRCALSLGLAPALLALAASQHATSKVSVIVGAVVAIACLVSLTAGRRILMMTWTIACLAVVPLCLAAYAADLHRLPLLAASAQDRLVIWKATSDLVPNAPILGVGIHSGRVITRAEFERPKAPGTPWALSVGWHSHNAFLQVWFETGAVGAMLLLSIGLLSIQAIGRQPSTVQPALFAAFAGCTMIAATGFSAFAPWLIAAFGLSALFAALAQTFATATGSAGNSVDDMKRKHQLR